MNAHQNPVRVSIPASIAADIGSLKKAVGGILDKLGCPACCSGENIFFELQRDFVLKENFASPTSFAPRARDVKTTGFPSTDTKQVTVGLNPELAGDIKNVHRAIERIAELTGHPACATGCDLFLQLERNFVMDEGFKFEELAMRA